ncbi:nitroreductase family protein [Flavobacterium sp. j3]|uniref:Nitroreductase family protein n=1 Tax=Flavobacterium aureirubrum TaxID=3133147 RepID=A0ABU9N7W9_9FLAO
MMSIIPALKWRYATKRMNGVKIPKEKMDIILEAISLAPTSFGLQPYTIIVIENKAMLEKIKPIAMRQPQITEASVLLVFAVWDSITMEKIEAYIAQIAKEREVTVASLDPVKDRMAEQLKNSDSDNLIWNAKQAYIALGFALVAAAVEQIDSTPMEGFDKALLDDVLQLKEKGLRSMLIMTLGYRDLKNDYLANLKKVRRPMESLFIEIK